LRLRDVVDPGFFSRERGFVECCLLDLGVYRKSV
jgi:hypothetical protein